MRGKERRRPPVRAIHEYVFGIREPFFRTYMLLQDTNEVPARELLRLSFEMAQNAYTHPLIEYAAGWAAAGAALHHTPDKSAPHFPLRERVSALRIAKTFWEGAESNFRVAKLAATRPDKAADFLGFELRAAQAVSYLPSMQLAASWFSGSELPDHEVAQTILSTKRELVSCARKILSGSERDEHYGKTKSGMYNELLSGLMPLSDPQRRLLMLPASLQQDHNPEAYLRADLVVVSMGIEHPSGLIQVTSDPEIRKGTTKRRLYIRANRDLAIDENIPPSRALKEFVRREEGKELSPYIQRMLNQRIARLSNRLHDFVRGQG